MFKNTQLARAQRKGAAPARCLVMLATHDYVCPRDITPTRERKNCRSQEPACWGPPVLHARVLRWLVRGAKEHALHVAQRVGGQVRRVQPNSDVLYLISKNPLDSGRVVLLFSFLWTTLEPLQSVAPGQENCTRSPAWRAPRIRTPRRCGCTSGLALRSGKATSRWTLTSAALAL